MTALVSYRYTTSALDAEIRLTASTLVKAALRGSGNYIWQEIVTGMRDDLDKLTLLKAYREQVAANTVVDLALWAQGDDLMLAVVEVSQ